MLSEQEKNLEEIVSRLLLSPLVKVDWSRWRSSTLQLSHPGWFQASQNIGTAADPGSRSSRLSPPGWFQASQNIGTAADPG